jgi:hypothetical protein
MCAHPGETCVAVCLAVEHLFELAKVLSLSDGAGLCTAWTGHT